MVSAWGIGAIVLQFPGSPTKSGEPEFVQQLPAAATDDISVAYSYDGFGRLGSTVIKKGTTTVRSDSYVYNDGAEADTTTGQIRKHTQTLTPTGITATTEYEYDANGNITRVTSGGKSTRYTYDSQNQLIREDNQAAGKSWTWTYDKGGNIQSKSEYAYTTGTLGTATGTATYLYDSDWGDLLISYNGVALNNDEIGNPAALNGRSYVWEHGRVLRQVSYGGTTWTNTYDVNGLRAKRESTGKTYTYVYNGSQLSRMTVTTSAGTNTLTFSYDASGTPVSVIHNGTTYYYVTNLQGDVVAILNASGNKATDYTYDAWGKLLTVTGSEQSGIGTLNPLMYRGYVYDYETGLYYLQSRYYDPEVGRFINTDAYASTGQGLVGYNMFAYCRNNPVSRIDKAGTADAEADDGRDELLELLEKYTSIEEDGIIIDIKIEGDEWDKAIKRMGVKKAYMFMAEYVCGKYKDLYGKDFLFTESCVAYEIEYHVDAYMRIKGKSGYSSHFTTWFMPKDDIDVSCSSVDIFATDVNSFAQSIMFGYRNGVRKQYRNTEEDPFFRISSLYS